MRISKLNEIEIGCKSYDLSSIRAKLIKQEVDRVGDLSFAYNGTRLGSDIRIKLRIYLETLWFRIVDGHTISLGEAFFDTSELITHRYFIDGSEYRGTIEEIKKWVTEYLKGEDIKLKAGSGVWLCDNYVLSKANEKIADIKARLVENEMRKIEEL